MATKAMTQDELARAFRTLGWKPNDAAGVSAAAAEFQRGWNLGPALLVDGKPGPRTQAALRASLDRRARKLGDASEHFSFVEFACRCGGRRKDCRVIRVHRQLLVGLEAYRAAVGRPLSIASGYRCDGYNATLAGAAKNSQHIYGAAADVAYAMSDLRVRRLRLFSGIGRSRRTKLVRHVDVRHCSGNNTTSSTPDQPMVWDYSE